MLWYAFNGLYLTIWSALLIHCLLRREFYPVFGPKWGTKVLWLLTFVFFNPLLTLVYFVFGFLLKPLKTEERGKLMGFGSAVAIACIGIVLVLFEWPYSRKPAEPLVVLSESGEEKPTEPNQSSSGFEVYVGTLEEKNSIHTFSTTSTEGGTRVCTRNILLLCQSPHLLLHRATLEFQKSLVRLPYVDRVAYYPFGTSPKPGGILPDVFITIDMPQFNEDNFLRGHKLKAVIKWKAGSSIFTGPSHSVHKYMPPVVKFDIESQLEHDSKMYGVESPKAKYKLEANDISREMIKSISKQFENLLDKHGQLPKLSEMLYGSYHEPPEFSFLKDDMSELLISGRGLFKNNHTVWRFVDERGTDKAHTAYQDELINLGWEAEDRNKQYLRMQKGNDHIYIFRPRRRDMKSGTILWGDLEKEVSKAPMIIHYESYLTSDQMEKAMDALLDSGMGIEDLLIFEKYFHTPQQSERLRSIVEQNPVHTLDGCLMLANYWADHDRQDKGRELLLRARAMQHVEKEHNVKAQEIKSLAKKLGDEGLATVPVGDEIFREMGFVNAEKPTEPLKIERALDQPVLFYRRLADNKINTFALRIIPSREPSPSIPFRLLTVEAREDSSSSNETGGRVKSNGVWVAETSVNNLTGQNEQMQLKVESLGNKRFLFVITP